ncbi:CBM96 family carbohydrate-binding protein [Pontiella sulfatireligans]|uniref:Uncharacterized protein n=1 Tax=Pontiella sulfatireligans TaxID=2750658 RepID=A0A6C2UMY3_9BACT|nr:DNRLRE domain-containing protein [Pontiella sulfatireligans]VGO20674.1 hypothetical protein SCARR_02740 [Pontiella sulfatireligans]
MFGLTPICVVTVMVGLAFGALAEPSQVGICDLQTRTERFDPDYVRVIQANNAHTGQALQWADVEPVQGTYDFSGLDLSLKQIQETGRYAIIKLNGNDKPDWLFDIAPYHTNTTWDTSVFDTIGIPMFWHTNFVSAYSNLLAAYGTYLETNAYHAIISGVRQNFNPIGTEHTSVPTEYRDLSQWFVPPGVEQGPEYSASIVLDYKNAIVDTHIERIMPHTFVYIRSNIEDSILETNRALFESGQLGFFHTGASMEQNQVFNQDWRYSRYLEFCKTGQTRGFCEMAGWFQYLDKYPATAFPKVQWNYWRLLSDLHCGVSMSGFHYSTLFSGLFGEPEYDASWQFADRYLGLHAEPSATPGAWVALRGTGDNYAGDYNFLMERLPGDTSTEVVNIGSINIRYGAWARSLPAGGTMNFSVNSNVFAVGEAMTARVVYFDGGTGNWEFRQGGGTAMTVTNANSGDWIEAETVISNSANLQFVNVGIEGAVFHMLELNRMEPPVVEPALTNVFTAADDTFIAQAYPDQNKGSLGFVRLRSDVGENAKTILVKFSVGSITGKIASVKLRLHSIDLEDLATVRPAASSWAETAVTWNTRPTLGEIIAGSHAVSGKWCEWDVTAVVTNSGTYSFAIENEINGDRDFTSKEGGLPPELIVELYDAEGSYRVWTGEHGLYDEAADHTADPDADEINNLLEYGLGGSPTNGDSAAMLPTFGSGLDYVYRRRSDAGLRGLDYQVITTTNLVTGTWSTNGCVETGDAEIDAAFEFVTNAVAMDQPHRFLQLLIEMD